MSSACAAGRACCVLITYHWSRGDTHGAAAPAFAYDTQAAIAHTHRKSKARSSTVFGSGHGTVYPLVCGFETDEDALLHPR
jgi:hypothetical protein